MRRLFLVFPVRISKNITPDKAYFFNKKRFHILSYFSMKKYVMVLIRSASTWKYGEHLVLRHLLKIVPERGHHCVQSSWQFLSTHFLFLSLNKINVSVLLSLYIVTPAYFTVLCSSVNLKKKYPKWLPGKVSKKLLTHCWLWQFHLTVYGNFDTLSILIYLEAAFACKIVSFLH